MNKLSALLPTGIQLGITFFVNRFIEPILKDFLDPLPVVAPPFITLILSGLIVVFVVDLTVARPRLMFRWSDPSSRTAQPAVVQLRSGQLEALDVQVELMGDSWLARWIRRALKTRTTTTIHLESDDAVELRPTDQSSRAVQVDADGTTVTLPFAATGTRWVSLTAEVTERAPAEISVKVAHAIETTGFRRALSCLVIKDHNVTTLLAIRAS